MDIRCWLGFHSWIPRAIRLPSPRLEWFCIPVIPSLFSGPPYMQPIYQYQTHWKKTGEQCKRCKQRKKP